MGLLEDISSDQDNLAFGDPDVFAELVWLTPRGGTRISLYAQVNRGERTITQESSALYAPGLEVDLPVAGLDGLTAEQLIGAVLEVRPAVGGEVANFVIRQGAVVAQDSGMIRVRLG